MSSVEYLKSTARLKESMLNCEAERLRLEQKLKAMKNSPSDSGGAMSGYYRDLCQRETSMQRRADAILEELDRSEASLRGLSRRVEQLRARRDQILNERAPVWRDEVIDFLRRRTSLDAAAAAAATAGTVSAASTASFGGGTGTGTGAAAAAAASTMGTSAVPPLNLSQLSKTSGAGTAAGAVGPAGAGWNTSGALLGLTESTIDSTSGMSRSGHGSAHDEGKRPKQQQQQQQQQLQKQLPPTAHRKTSALDEDDEEAAERRTPDPGSLSSRRSQEEATGGLGSSRTVSDLTVSGLVRLLDFIDAEMERAQPRVLAGYYASSPPSDALREELCRAANGPGGMPSHLSAVSATCLVLEELEMVVSTRLQGGCVFPERLVDALTGVQDPRQLERQIDMNLTDEARVVWRRLLMHMRRLVKRARQPGAQVARLFCPALMHHRSAPDSGAQLVDVVARILDLPAGDSLDGGVGGADVEDDDDEDSVTIASDRMPAPAVRPTSRPPPVVGESMRATAGSFVDEDDDEEELSLRSGTGRGPGSVGNSLNVTGNPELRASKSDAHKAYAAQLAEESGDDSSITELTMQSGTNRSGFFSHHSPQRNLKDSSEYQKLLHGALGAPNPSAAAATKTPSAAASVPVSKPAEKSAGSVQPDLWRSQEAVAAAAAQKDDHDMESDMDSELENSFRMRLSGGATFKSQLMAGAASKPAQRPATHAENDDEDFGGFFD